MADGVKFLFWPVPSIWQSSQVNGVSYREGWLSAAGSLPVPWHDQHFLFSEGYPPGDGALMFRLLWMAFDTFIALKLTSLPGPAEPPVLWHCVQSGPPDTPTFRLCE